ncbi:MAG: hypothetical protein MH204_11290, partial [Fimbriimonadaceae bacterium]|nr:hypothetical protein [Fimbriimonadaceae bacterium]
SVRDRDQSKALARSNEYEAKAPPAYIEPDVPKMSGKIIMEAERQDFPEFFGEQKVIEFYARG